MKKILCLLFCLIFAFTATGCNLFKSDQEIFDELTEKFEQDAKVATTREECIKIGEEYKTAVPQAFKEKANKKVENILFWNFNEGKSKLGHYSE